MRAALAAFGLLAACAGTPPCPPGTGPASVAEAYFGRAITGSGQVSEAEWQAFLGDTLTPAFPDGLTALEGAGQWRGGDGRVLREPTKVVVVVLPGHDVGAARARLRPVEEAWKARFRQRSVLTVYRSACAGF